MGIGMWELLIILAIVLVIFGAKKLRNLGGDVGGAIKNFKQAMKEDEAKGDAAGDTSDRVIEGEVTSKNKRSS